jgi:hypothetical protein
MLIDKDLFSDMIHRILKDNNNPDSPEEKDNKETSRCIQKLVLEHESSVTEIIDKLFKDSEYYISRPSPKAFRAYEFTLLWTGFLLGLKFGKDSTSFSTKH